MYRWDEVVNFRASRWGLEVFFFMVFVKIFSNSSTDTKLVC